MKNKINVIDLDKTLIPYDSFRLLIVKELKGFDLYVCGFTLLRVIRLISVKKFKFHLTKYFCRKYDEYYFRDFASRLYLDIDQKVMEIIMNETDDKTVNVLLSASPDLFVKHLIDKLGWKGSGSYIENNTFYHLYGSGKLNWLLKYKKENIIFNFAISDSETDDQLMALFNKRIKWTLH